MQWNIYFPFVQNLITRQIVGKFFVPKIEFQHTFAQHTSTSLYWRKRLFPCCAFTCCLSFSSLVPVFLPSYSGDETQTEIKKRAKGQTRWGKRDAEWFHVMQETSGFCSFPLIRSLLTSCQHQSSHGYHCSHTVDSLPVVHSDAWFTFWICLCTAPWSTIWWGTHVHRRMHQLMQ